ncbi:MAG TPA: helix-turn-helix transcriptional regulator [Stellaceae bacterium]|nr:helix-turn-helix transcriptional regulator [Stellaceae bacterium]
MRARAEIVFPNNIRDIRLRRGMTQAQVGRMMEPPIGESAVSKMESGERRLTNLQLASLAAILNCPPEEIPVVTGRDPIDGVRRWQQAQQEVVGSSIASGAAAAGYVLAQLRKKHGRTMQQVASAIGMTLSVYHRMEMASRMIQAEEIEKVAKFYGMTAADIVALIERRTTDNLRQLKEGVPVEQLLPRVPRSLLKEDAKWGRLGALERYALRRSIRYSPAAPSPQPTSLPVRGRMKAGQNSVNRFTIDREAVAEQVAIHDLLRPSETGFLVRNFSQRLGVLLRPGALAYVDPEIPAAMGDIVFLTRTDGTADAAVVVGDGIGPLMLKMYNPEEQIPIGDPGIAAVLRVGMLLLP